MSRILLLYQLYQINFMLFRRLDIKHLDQLVDLFTLQLLSDPLVDVLYLQDLHSDRDLTLDGCEFEGVRHKVHDDLLIASLISVNASKYLTILLLKPIEFPALIIQYFDDMDLLFLGQILARAD